MERKGKLFCLFLTGIITALLCAGCNVSEDIGHLSGNDTEIIFRCPGFSTKASARDDSMIHNINLIIFHEGETEYQEWIRPPAGEDMFIFKVRLVKGRQYKLYALANYGKRLEPGTLDALEELYIELDSPDIAAGGCLMSAMTDVVASPGSTIEVELCRMMAKVSISVDRSRLSEDVEMDIRKVSVGNCPKYIRAIGENRMQNRFDRFEGGFSISGTECRELNQVGQGGVSGEVALYLLENMQGDFPQQIEEDEEKVLDSDDPLAEICSYVEIEVEYRSSLHFSTERNLVYRFYLGEGLEDLNVERNCHYHITVTPEDDGLSGSGWRVDKTGIGTFVNQIILSEYSIRMNYEGQENLLEAEVLPVEATEKEVSWRSSDSRIAMVSPDGIVTAGKEGTCRITCMADDGSGTTAVCDVEVRHDPPRFNMYPDSYVSGHVGDTIHIWCDFFPPNAPFDPGYEELDYDKSRGIYDYKIDDDGHGVTLTLKKAGTGIVYMTAGSPVNESGMTIVEVKP